MRESVGARIYEIRRALGPDVRTEMPLRAFAALLTQTSGKPFSDSELSKMERGVRGVSLEIVAAIAAVDPLHRGPGWLAFGEAAAPALPPAAEILEQGPVSSGLVTHGKAKKLPATKRRGTA